MSRGCLAVLLMLASAPAAAMDGLPLPKGAAISVPQAQSLARRHPELASCLRHESAYLAAGWPRGEGFDTVSRLDQRLHAQMTFRTDSGADRWSLLTGPLMNGRKVQGDCEDMAITAAHLAICAGIPADRLGLLITSSPKPGASELHMLAYYQDAANRVWVFGDTFGQARSLSKMRERVLFMASMRDPTAWYSLLRSDGPFSDTSSLPPPPATD